MKAILGAISVAALFQAGMTNKCQCGIANDKGVKNRIEVGLTPLLINILGWWELEDHQDFVEEVSYQTSTF